MKNRIEIVRVPTHKFPNELHFMFMTENRRLYDKYGVRELAIDPFMPEYDAALADEDIALELVRKSAETQRIAVADTEFDTSFSGMRDYARLGLKHYDPNVRQSAENLWVIFEHYGNIAPLAYHQELGASFNLLQDLRARTNDYTITGIAPWADAHEQAANNLSNLLALRTEEQSQQSDLRVRDVRIRMDIAYQKVTDRLDAKINLEGKDFVPGFVAEYNTHATEYKNKLAQHLGRIKKEIENGLRRLYGTQMTRIGRMFADFFCTEIRLRIENGLRRLYGTQMKRIGRMFADFFVPKFD